MTEGTTTRVLSGGVAGRRASRYGWTSVGRHILASTLATLVMGAAGSNVLLAAGGGAELPAPGDELRIISVDTTNFPQVTATVALPLRARGLGDISAGLSVTSSGAQVPAVSERLPADGRAVAILIDNAAGTERATLLMQQAAAAEFLRQLDPITPIIVGSSASGVLFGPAADLGGALKAVGTLDIAGQRQWMSSVDSALDLIDSDRRGAMVVVSAGPSTEDSSAPADLAQRLVSDTLTIRWISLADDGGPTGALQGIQSVTSPSSNGLLVRLDSYAAELGAQYRLTFEVDPRATAAAITLAVNGLTWVVETPLPLPSIPFVPPPTVEPSIVPQDPALPVAQGTPTPPATAATTATQVSNVPVVSEITIGRLRHFSDFFENNWVLVVAGFVTLDLLVVSVYLARAPRSRPNKEGQRKRSTVSLT